MADLTALAHYLTNLANDRDTFPHPAALREAAEHLHRLAALERDNARLRAALEAIAAEPATLTNAYGANAAIAREALEHSPTIVPGLEGEA